MNDKGDFNIDLFNKLGCFLHVYRLLRNIATFWKPPDEDKSDDKIRFTLRSHANQEWDTTLSSGPKLDEPVSETASSSEEVDMDLTSDYSDG
ncbi:hypothetical protein FQN57_005243 [Myotisia sp. PD_48]|nr:hypothetical protein FQN57_005243 [Myotisia sp. PD_48]